MKIFRRRCRTVGRERELRQFQRYYDRWLLKTRSPSLRRLLSSLRTLFFLPVSVSVRAILLLLSTPLSSPTLAILSTSPFQRFTSQPSLSLSLRLALSAPHSRNPRSPPLLLLLAVPDLFYSTDVIAACIFHQTRPPSVYTRLYPSVCPSIRAVLVCS